MDFHEAANIFPLDEEHLDDLAADIRKHGLQVPIELMDSKILDGRRRYLACQKAKVEPKYREVSPDDPVEYVLSLNLHRRHLSTTQAGVCAAKAQALQEKLKMEAKGRQRLSKGRGQKGQDNCPDLNEAGQTRDKIGERFGVSGKTVDRARKAMDKGIPEVVKAMEEDKISTYRAAYIANHKPELQKDLLEAELKQEQRSRPRAEPQEPQDSNGVPPENKSLRHAQEAINCLRRIPKNDIYRKRCFQVVTDWIRHNK